MQVKQQRLKQGGVTSQLPKAGQLVDSRANLMGHRAGLKTELPHHAREGADQTRLQLEVNASATW
jgi:hypothetical protein